MTNPVSSYATTELEFLLEFLQEHGDHLPHCSCGRVREEIQARIEALERVVEAAQRHVDEARFGGPVTLGWPDLVAALDALKGKNVP